MGPVRLGFSRVVDARSGSARLGTALSKCAAWFHIRYDDGTATNVRGPALAEVLVFSAADFRNPDFYYNDLSLINPLRIPGWCAGLLEFLAENNTVLPRA